MTRHEDFDTSIPMKRNKPRPNAAKITPVGDGTYELEGSRHRWVYLNHSGSRNTRESSCKCGCHLVPICPHCACNREEDNVEIEEGNTNL